MTLQVWRVRESLPSEVGGRIRRARLAQGLTQAVLARRIGITQAALSNYEVGKRDVPLSTFTALAFALDLTASDLLPPVA
ncbi:MAG: helix-turn-helix domain-containing protein [Dehalococcoidia bacterium]|nr:helix-turn-helix domain-containing protein [Dehalococcoidia bacterium]